MSGGPWLIHSKNDSIGPVTPKWTHFGFCVGAGYLARYTSLFLEWSISFYFWLIGTLFLCTLQQLGG